MRTPVLVLLTAASLAALGAAPAHATEAERPGCKGIDKAFSKASTQGKAALTAVSEKFGCGTVTPDPVDTVACPTGQTSLSRWTYTGTGTPDTVYGGFTWTNSVWTLTSGSAAAASPVLNANPDGNGFYWSEGSPDLVQSIVMQSFSGEVVTLTDAVPANDPGWALDPSHAVSGNKLSSRTGINLVNFCGTSA